MMETDPVASTMDGNAPAGPTVPGPVYLALQEFPAARGYALPAGDRYRPLATEQERDP